MEIIAKIRTDFPTKFGVPRQSGLSPLISQIVFEPQYRSPDCIKGLDEFSYLWILWQFSENVNKPFSPTVRPPRLGGNKRMGVFATRSPFRPNSIGLSSVRIEKILLDTPDGSIIYVSGADMLDGTPIFDIKPYLPYTDSHPNAKGGFADNVKDYSLEVDFPADYLISIPKNLRDGLIKILSQDPRPSYHNDPNRIYGFEFSDYEIQFTVCEKLLTVCDVQMRK